MIVNVGQQAIGLHDAVIIKDTTWESYDPQSLFDFVSKKLYIIVSKCNIKHSKDSNNNWERAAYWLITLNESEHQGGTGDLFVNV